MKLNTVVGIMFCIAGRTHASADEETVLSLDLAAVEMSTAPPADADSAPADDEMSFICYGESEEVVKVSKLGLEKVGWEGSLLHLQAQLTEGTEELPLIAASGGVNCELIKKAFSWVNKYDGGAIKIPLWKGETEVVLLKNSGLTSNDLDLVGFKSFAELDALQLTASYLSLDKMQAVVNAAVAAHIMYLLDNATRDELIAELGIKEALAHQPSQGSTLSDRDSTSKAAEDRD